ncbi:MAG: primosomal protein N' [Muribaculum sp.]|nr:primosomal protein N' [Muribaculum sp.]
MSSATPQYAQVILPLPLNTTFTYIVPDTMQGKIVVGSRVIVQFGSRRYYTAIVIGFTDTPPQGFEIKSIIECLDTDPIINAPQLKFWEWISEYYLGSIGDVYKAAIPAGLKIESDSYIELLPDAPEIDSRSISEREAILLQALDHHGRMRVSDLEKHTGLRGTATLVGRLVEQGRICISEQLVNRYRTRRITMVRPLFDREDNDAIAKAFDTVSHAPQQQALLIALIDIMNKRRSLNLPLEVPRNELIEKAGVTTAISGALAAKGIIELYQKEVSRFALSDSAISPLPTLSEAQAKAFEEIKHSFETHDVTLLHGVTSSGKTELYIHLIDSILQRRRRALYLVPEIALTTQLTRRLQRVFGSRVIIYHSKFSDNERVDIWKRVLSASEPYVVIGARSAVFLPFSDLDLIIVDEEHESSYKQFDPAPRYNARDSAIVLASMYGAKTLLGSATPSIETYYKASSGRYGLVTLSERYQGVKLPPIELIDLTDERKHQRLQGPMSGRLIQQVRNTTSHGNQAILFLNRRGYAPVVTCRQCAYVPKCQYCDVAMTYHRSTGEMVCHYCGSTVKLPTICPSCHEPAITTYGYGTERIETVADAAFPGVNIMRMDLDTTRNKDSYEKIITGFSRGEAQILVGTQMVTKGLDFDRVSIVGVLNADNLINMPDFRSAERAFNMLEQVSGRAGRRSSDDARVIIQTSVPSHPILQYVLTHDYIGFYNHELEERRMFCYPPFTRVINIYIKHRDAHLTADFAMHYAATLRELFGNRVYGPETPWVDKIQNLYIRKIMLKIETAASMKKVKKILRDVYERYMADPRLRQLTIYYDVDPY